MAQDGEKYRAGMILPNIQVFFIPSRSNVFDFSLDLEKEHRRVEKPLFNPDSIADMVTDFKQASLWVPLKQFLGLILKRLPVILYSCMYCTVITR